ncbi:MAG TPA: hypothetical protein VGF48_05770 [Thermoanaerobaculia bacterium]|jgi:hypothetical protein
MASKWSDPEFRRKYNREYRRKNVLKIRVRNRFWMRKRRADEKRLIRKYGAVDKSAA